MKINIRKTAIYQTYCVIDNFICNVYYFTIITIKIKMNKLKEYDTTN